MQTTTMLLALLVVCTSVVERASAMYSSTDATSSKTPTPFMLHALSME